VILVTDETASSDLAVLDLLRRRHGLTVAQLAESTGVTATAVRQRLNRLMGQQLIERSASREGRGRPSHNYKLTEKGHRQAGANFADLAIVLWEEIRAIKDIEVRRGLFSRIGGRLASRYEDQISGDTVEERMQSLAQMFEQHRIPCDVEVIDEVPVLSVLACPYPQLAAVDRGVCAMENSLLNDLLGEKVHLTQCRLDGEGGCQFELA